MNIKLGTCSRLRSRISERQCEINRKGLPASKGRTHVPACFACDSCQGLLDIQPVDYEPQTTPDKPVIAPLVTSIKETVMSNRGTCKYCKRENLCLPLKDTCGRCRDRLKRGVDPLSEGTPQKTVSAPKAQKAAVSKTETAAAQQAVAPDSLEQLFADDKELLLTIKDAAKRNRRSLAGEILYRLDQTVEAA